MATPEQLEKKRTRQIDEILAAINGLTAEVADLKTEIKIQEGVLNMLVSEIARLKTEISDLKALLSKPATARKGSK